MTEPAAHPAAADKEKALMEPARELRLRHVSRYSDEVLLQQRTDAISMQKHHAKMPFRFSAVPAIVSGMGGVAMDRLMKALGVFERLGPTKQAVAEDAVLLGAGVGTAYLWGAHQKKQDDRKVESEAQIEIDRYNDELEARTGIRTETLGTQKITPERLAVLRAEHGARGSTESDTGNHGERVLAGKLAASGASAGIG